MNKQYLYIGLGVIGIGVGAYFIMNKPKTTGESDDSDRKKEKPNPDMTVESGKNKGKPDYGKIAKEIYDALKGWGSDTSKINNSIIGLSKSQIEEVKDYFDKYLGGGQTLQEWIEDDYSWAAETEMLKKFNYV